MITNQKLGQSEGHLAYVAVLPAECHSLWAPCEVNDVYAGIDMCLLLH